MPPAVVGIYEMQADRIDATLARLFEDYYQQTYRQSVPPQPLTHRLLDPHMYRHRAHHQPLAFHVAQARAFHNRFQFIGREEFVDGLRQVRVRIALPADQPADERHDLIEEEQEEGAQ